MDILYKNIRRRRKELNITQKQLADKCGYSDPSTINKMENGNVDITYKRLKQIAAILDLTVVDLIRGDF